MDWLSQNIYIKKYNDYLHIRLWIMKWMNMSEFYWSMKIAHDAIWINSSMATRTLAVASPSNGSLECNKQSPSRLLGCT